MTFLRSKNEHKEVIEAILWVGQIYWLVSNYIPMDSLKFKFRDFDSIIRFAVKNASESEKLRSRDRFFKEFIGISLKPTISSIMHFHRLICIFLSLKALNNP